MKSKIYTLLLLLALIGCVSEFNADIPLSGTNILVVEGNIIANSTVDFYFSKSFGLDEDNPPEGYDDVSVNLMIIGENGFRSSQATYLGHGVHRIEVGALEPNIAYGIEFQYEGDTYRSDLSKHLLTPEIDEITYQQPEKYGDVSIHISTHDDHSESASYYLWNYTEDWEITVAYATNIFFDPYIPGFYLDNTHPRLYCWKNNINKDVLVGTTESLVENRILNRKLISKESANDRFSYLYRVKVQQQAISKAGYEYYLDKSKSNTGMGGLFTPQPSKIEGNMKCITDESKNVIGFIEVAQNVTESALYIPTVEISKRPDIFDCDEKDFSNVMSYPPLDSYIELYYQGYRPILSAILDDKPFGSIWVKTRCADCTYSQATKNKPDNWPNDHQ